MLSPSEIENSIIRMNDDVIARQTGGAVVLVHLSTNRIYELNETGTRIWELLEQRRSSTEIKDQLCTEFTVTPPQARDAYNKLVSELIQEGLVRRESPST
jgi:hypothetical protein